MFSVAIATPNDAEEIAKLVNSAYRGESSRAGWTTEADLLDGQRTDAGTIRATIADPGQILMILRGKGQDPILGCVTIERIQDHHGTHCYLGMLTIDPQLQGNGAGGFLLSTAERHAAKHWNARRVTLGVIQLRDSLIAWYERHGYKKTGQTKPFPYGELQFGIPKRSDLHFVLLEKTI